MSTMTTYPVKPGDVIEIHGHRVGEHPRLGEILEVIGDPGREHFRVRWEDDHEAIVYPAEDAIIRPARPGKKH
jgi:hypothetical protein